MSTDDLSALRIEREPIRESSAGKWIVRIGLLILLGTLGAGAYFYVTRPRPIEVEVATVSQRAAGAQASVLNASGYVTARRRATVSSKVTGKVIEVNVEEGMAVKEGQVLARLDDSTLQAALAFYRAQLEAAKRQIPETQVRLEKARTDMRRQEQLRQEGLNTPSDIDSAKADVDSLVARIASAQEQVKVAESQIAMQQTAIDDTIIRAPFTGIAISKDAQPGEMVSPVSAGGGFTRTGISTIVDMHSLEIEVDVNESYIGRVTEGQPVTATLKAYPDWQIPAKVITTVPTADRQKATVLVRIAFLQLDPRILPDMGVTVTFLREADKAAAPTAQPTTLVPKIAVKEDSGKSYVFLVQERGQQQSVERRAVQVGGNDGDRVEVLAGLRNGDRVVVSPPPDLAEGKLITVK